MQNQTIGNFKLGIFVLAGLLFVILLLYMIGRNRNMFGPHFTLKARFDNIDGLKPGHNVRYAGIEVGTVSGIQIINDTVIEVSMTLNKEFSKVIRSNAVTAIGTDGLVGNKVVNITAVAAPAPIAPDGSILPSRQRLDTDEMLRTLSVTNRDIAVTAAQLRTAVTRLNNSNAFWHLLNDGSFPASLKRTAVNIQKASLRADSIVAGLQFAVNDLKNGKGLLGTLLYDTTVNKQLMVSLKKIEGVGDAADSLAAQISRSISNITNEIDNGQGTLHAVLKDSALAGKLSRSMDNISKGTEGFNQNMEALKHHFLFSGYFKKLEREQKAAATKNK